MLVVEQIINPGQMKKLQKAGTENDCAKQDRLLIPNRMDQGDNESGCQQKVSVRFCRWSAKGHPA